MAKQKKKQQTSGSGSSSQVDVSSAWSKAERELAIKDVQKEKIKSSVKSETSKKNFAVSYRPHPARTIGNLKRAENILSQGHTDSEEKTDQYTPSQATASVYKQSFDSVRKVRLKQKTRKKAERNTVKNGSTVKNGYKKTAKFAKKIVKGVKASAKKLGVIAATGMAPIMIFLIIITSFTSFAAGSKAGETTYQSLISEKVEGYRDLAEKYCEVYGIDDFVDLVLAIIQQESGGKEPDVMQSAESGLCPDPPVDTAEKSIDAGVHALSLCLKAAKCDDPSDLDGVSLALQGYNFGTGYITWALKNYKKYTADNALTFSMMKRSELGWSSYGDPEYVQHVLRYYAANPSTEVDNESAKNIIKELEKNNKASAAQWKVIEKGASLIGKVSYSMPERQADGRDNPKKLDCSSFTAWAFHKAGITQIPYAMTTATFIGSSKFVPVAGSELQVGDIGLKSTTMETGAANHIGIYCGQLKNGTKVWLHCTSSSGSSLTGNSDGVMFGAYTNFTYFMRLKKWDSK